MFIHDQTIIKIIIIRPNSQKHYLRSNGHRNYYYYKSKQLKKEHSFRSNDHRINNVYLRSNDHRNNYYPRPNNHWKTKSLPDIKQ